MDFDILKQLPGFIGWKDKKLNYLGCNDNLAKILSFKHPEQIIGMKDEDLSDNQLDNDFHRKNDLLALAGETVTAFHKSSYPYDGAYFYLTKKPLYMENEIIGDIFYCQEIRMTASLKQMMAHYESTNHRTACYHLKSKPNPKRLSNRELECLFFLLRGSKTKAIAAQLDLTPRTVDFYIENIKIKFNCHSRACVINEAYALGYHYYFLEHPLPCL